MTKTRVLIVEDDVILAMGLEDDLEEAGYEVVGVAATAEDAVERALESRPDVVLMDVRLKGSRDGVDAAREIHERGEATKVIFVTASHERPTVDRIHADNPASLLFKPVSSGEVDAEIRKVVS